MSSQKIKDIVKLSNAYRMALEMSEVVVNLAGLEPTLWKENNNNVIDLIKELRSNGCTVEMTTNGSRLKDLYEDFIKAGLSKCRVSIHSFNRNTYKNITGKDTLPSVLEGIRRCKDSSLKIVINRTLLNGFTDDIYQGLSFVQEENLTLKLYDLWWVPRTEKRYAQYYVGCDEIVKKYVLPITVESIKKSTEFQRSRILYKLKDGGYVDVKYFDESLHGNFEICNSCFVQSKCKESFGSYVHIFSNGNLTFCNLREDIHFDLESLLLKDASENEIAWFLKYKFDELLGESWKKYIKSSALRFYINETCNFRCCFPNTKPDYNSLWCLSSVRTKEMWNINYPELLPNESEKKGVDLWDRK